MKALILTAALLGLAVCVLAQQSKPAQANQVHAVHASGCVQQGVEAGCLLMKDTQSGKLYQLLIRGARPEAGMAIEMTGSSFRGVTSCMQGQPVSVAKWSRSAAQQCSAGEATQRRSAHP
ncbi:MAG: hypothetical protein ACLGPM_05260 [Acidobacteriota bacterium]